MNPQKQTGNQFAVLAKLGSGSPPVAKKKVEPLFGGKYTGNQLGQMRKKMAELFPDHPKDQRAPRELEGRALKKLGKELGNQSHIDQGRQLQYGHLPPEQLLVQHPSAFLRANTIRGNFLQHSENPLRGNKAKNGFSEKASTQRSFHLVDSQSLPGYSGVSNNQIIDSKSGQDNQRKGDFSLVQDTHKTLVKNAYGVGDEPFNRNLQGAFLPMLQAQHKQLTSAPSSKNVTAFKRGALDTASLDQPSHPVFTTELTGCSVVRHKNALAHIRPHPAGDGTTLHSSFTPAQSYGRKDYQDAENAFVMTRQKPDGRTKLYYQTHHGDEPSRSGSRYLEHAKQ